MYKGRTIYVSCSPIGKISHIRLVTIVPSSAPDHSVFPSPEKATWRTSTWCSENVASSAPSLVLHNRTVRSSDADAMYVPHAEKSTWLTISQCPSSEHISAPVYASQIFIVPSHDAVTTSCPSGGENAATAAPVFPKLISSAPVWTFKIFDVSSGNAIRRRVLLESKVAVSGGSTESSELSERSGLQSGLCGMRDTTSQV